MFELQIVGTEFSDQLVKLWVDTFKQAYEDVHSPEDIAAYCAANFTAESASDELSSPQTVCCIASVENDPRGFYLVKHHGCPIPVAADASELKQIYVLASEYGNGLGRSLYEHATECIRAAGSGCVWLSVADINLRAQAFYKKLGFDRLGPGPILEVGSERLTSSIMAYRF
ncbi:MAG: GNAT family N-acetyltransferase [Proteobacteria bacterium]|nr:GNAT family N-acetyltransferase [Pseudomonadota bacterium]